MLSCESEPIISTEVAVINLVILSAMIFFQAFYDQKRHL